MRAGLDGQPYVGLRPLIGALVALVGYPVTLVGYPVTLVGYPVTLVGDLFALVGDLFALVGDPANTQEVLTSHPSCNWGRSGRGPRWWGRGKAPSHPPHGLAPSPRIS